MEIEAINEDGSIGKEKLLEQCNDYLKDLNILSSDLISGSSSNLDIV